MLTSSAHPLFTIAARRPALRAWAGRLLVLAALVGIEGETIAGTGDRSVAAGTARAVLLETMVISHTGGRALVFGRFAAGGGGTVVVTPAGAGSVTGEVRFVSGSNTAADRFGVSGGRNRSYSIFTTGGIVSSGSATMAFTTRPSATTQVLNGGGQGNFTVGGTLTVPAGAPAGSYVGTYQASVFYN